MANIDKGLYAAPQGLASIDNSEPSHQIEIEIENPDAVHINMDGVELDIMPGEGEDFYRNLVEDLDESYMQTLASDLLGEVDSDVSSRKDWITTYANSLDLLGIKYEDRTEPFIGASGIVHPLLLEAIVKFQSDTMQATFPAAGPVKTQIVGKETPQTREAAERVQEDMNYQLMDVMPEFRPEHERALFGLALCGNSFKKVYFDPQLERQTSIYVPAEDLIVPYGAPNLELAERVTHVMRKTKNEMRKLQVSGFYCDVDLGDPQNVMDEVEKKIAERMGFRASMDDRFKVFEVQCYLDLPGFEHTDDGEDTGVKLPYIVTLEKGTSTVLAIRRNWKEGDPTYQKRQHFVHYTYCPGFGFYAFGLVHLIGGYAKSSTSILRQLIDAGTLANLPGGLKSRGLRDRGDNTPIAPGEWRDMDVPSGSIRDNIMPLPYKEPSQTLLALLNNVIQEGKQFSNAADLQVSDMNSESPVGTTLAILEQSLKVSSAIQARVHYSMKQELGLLKEIIAECAPEDYEYDPNNASRSVRQSDYDLTEVIPVSDPNASTMAQRIMQYQAAMQLAVQAPQLYNLAYLHQQMLETLGIKNVDKLIPTGKDQLPTDPVTENQNLLLMKPVKAFEYQDHQSHIAVHMSAMQDPKLQQLIQANPQAQMIQAAVMSHINEHLGFEYRRQIEIQLGMVLPPSTDEDGEPVGMDPQVEARLSPLLATAAQNLLRGNQQQAAQQQAQQQAQDPIVQMQQQELQLKAQDLGLKKQKQDADISFRQQELQLRAQEIKDHKAIADQQSRVTAASAVTAAQTAKKTTLIKTAADLLKHDVNTKQKTVDRQVNMAKEYLKAKNDNVNRKEDRIFDGKKTLLQHEKTLEKLTKNEENLTEFPGSSSESGE